jgi:hypothetical protein
MLNTDCLAERGSLKSFVNWEILLVDIVRCCGFGSICARQVRFYFLNVLGSHAVIGVVTGTSNFFQARLL